MPMPNSEARKREERRTAPRFSVDVDAHGDVYVWRSQVGDIYSPSAVLNRRDVKDDELWGIILAAVALYEAQA